MHPAPLTPLRSQTKNGARSEASSTAATPSPATAPAATNSGDVAAQAAKALGLAKNYIALRKFALARERLHKIIQTYPGTPSAKEADDLLRQIDGQ